MTKVFPAIGFLSFKKTEPIGLSVSLPRRRRQRHLQFAKAFQRHFKGISKAYNVKNRFQLCRQAEWKARPAIGKLKGIFEFLRMGVDVQHVSCTLHQGRNARRKNDRVSLIDSFELVYHFANDTKSFVRF